MKKTLFDLYQSAHKAALGTLAVVSSFARENAAIEAFNADANDPADWDYWKQQFDQRRAIMLQLKTQPAPSAKPAAPAPASAPATPAPKS